MATSFDAWASMYPTWDQLSPAQRKMYGGDPTSYETMRSAHIRYAQPWVDQGLNTTIDPETLARLQAARAANPSGRVSLGESAAGPLWGYDPSMTVGDYTIGEDGSIGKSLQRETWGQDVTAMYDDQGRLISTGSGDSTALGLTKFILSSLAAYGGVNAADGLVNGATAASAGGGAAPTGMENGAWLGEGVASGVPAWDAAAIKSALGSGQLGTALNYAGQTMNGGTAMETLGKMATSTGADVATKAAVNAATGSGLNMGSVLGAVAGALDSKDKESKSSREPWKPMQPYLMGLAEDGRDLYNQYKAQPFSQAQQTAYGNVGGLLDVLNQNAGGLLQGMQANATGQNQFVRGQPQRLVGSAPINGDLFAPGLLGNYGTRRW